MSGGRYVLHHDRTWFYYLAEAMAWTGAEFAADGIPMTPAQSRYWYAAGHEAAVITMSRPQPEVVTGYRLGDPDAASVRYPLELSPEDYDRRRNLDDEESLFCLYARLTDPAARVTEEIPGPWLRLDGEPPPEGGREWRAELPYELGERREYLHLFPGYIPGFRDAMRKRIGALPRVRFATEAKRHGQPWGLEVTLEIPFDKPVTRHEPARNLDGSASRSRRGRTVTVMARRELELHVPYVMHGSSRAEAEADWDAAEAALVAAVEAASVLACAACRGTGHVISGSEDREKETR